MPTLVPATSLKDISNYGERLVAKALLNGLPEDCVIYHSCSWLHSDSKSREGSSRLREGEADFVVLHPAYGVLVLEVKGGDVFYSSTVATWHRREKTRIVPIKDPFKQARNSMHVFEKRFKAAIPCTGSGREKQLPFSYGYAVVFPECELRGEPYGSDRRVTIASQDMDKMGPAIERVFRHWKGSRGAERLDTGLVRAIRSVLSPDFEVRPVLSRKLAKQEEKLIELTDEQQRAFRLIARRRRALIEGVAGSGKTLLAIMQAKKFSADGLQTLLVCYTRTLAEWIRDYQVGGGNPNLVVTHFHALCADYCKAASIPFEVPSANEDAFWAEEAPELLLEALECGGSKFDAIVVDEGQDFERLWWAAIDGLEKEGGKGRLYVFYDPAQNLFVDESSLPDCGEPLVLSINCRNTRNISAACQRVIGVDLEVHPSAPEGDPCRVEVIRDPEVQRQRCAELVRAWLKEGGLQRSQIAILTPWGQKRSMFGEAESLEGVVALTHDLTAWRQGKGVLSKSIRSFKGLEADAVIVCEVPAPGRFRVFKRADLYVAASRAKHILVVLATDEAVCRVLDKST